MNADQIGLPVDTTADPLPDLARRFMAKSARLRPKSMDVNAVVALYVTHLQQRL